MKRKILLAMLATVLPLAAFAGNEGKVQVVTSFSDATNCISPIAVKKIDGKEATVQRMGFWIEPGKHSISGSTIVDTSVCPVVGFNADRYQPEPIEVDFELGKVYYIGFDHKSADRKDWKFVVWKVKDAKD